MFSIRAVRSLFSSLSYIKPIPCFVRHVFLAVRGKLFRKMRSMVFPGVSGDFHIRFPHAVFLRRFASYSPYTIFLRREEMGAGKRVVGRGNSGSGE